MRRTRIPALALTAALAVSAALPAAAAEEEPLTRAESAQQAIEAAAAYGGAVSIQYALWEDGEITMTGRSGTFSKSENRLLTDQDLYGIGSVSKMYTTAAVLQLVEKGKVDLDEPVKTYLPEFTMADERYVDITVRMLLNHSSGLMGDSTQSAFLFGEYNGEATDRLLERLSTQRLKADPGAYSVYCNDGFTLAELVVEAVSGEDFSAYVREHILAPAGLENTWSPAEEFDRDALARVYQGEDPRALPADTLNIVGAGGFYATASDLAAFGGLFCGGNGILSDASWEATANREYAGGIWAEESEDDVLAYGLGWDNVHMYPFQDNGITALVKGGDTLYYHAGLVVLPEEDMAVAVVSSGGVSTYNELAGVQILMDALAEKGVTVEQSTALPEAQPAALPEGLAEEVSGAYSGLTAMVTVSPSENGITLAAVAALGGNRMELTYYDDGSFRDAENTVRYRFVTEENGRTYLYEQTYTVLPGLPAVGTANYALERLEDHPLPADVAAAWEERGEKVYLIVNEAYNAQTYAVSSLFAGVGILPEMPGYAANCQIIDAENARYYLTLPGTGSRNGADLRFFTQEGVEYLQFGGYLAVDSASIPAIYTGAGAALSIQSDGYARWCRVGASAGKTVEIGIQGTGGFSVYDANGLMTASSAAWGDTSAVLPEGGWIVFAGDAGTRFTLTAQ